MTELDERTGLKFVSVGQCAECTECNPEGLDDSELCVEGFFSWSSCDICGSTLGGDRFPAHGIDPESEDLVHLDVCVDCWCGDES